MFYQLSDFSLGTAEEKHKRLLRNETTGLARHQLAYPQKMFALRCCATCLPSIALTCIERTEYRQADRSPFVPTVLPFVPTVLRRLLIIAPQASCGLTNDKIKHFVVGDENNKVMETNKRIRNQLV